MLKNPPLRPEFETYPERKKGQTGQEKDLLHIWEMNHVRPDRRIVTIYIEPRRLQTKLQYILVFIQIFKERKCKQMCDIEVNYI